MKQRRIIAVQLLNDFSGSPLILRQSLDALKNENEIHLFTGSVSRKGFLSNIGTVKEHRFYFRQGSNGILNMFFFLLSQTVLFIKLVRFLKKGDTVYINTLLPAGAAIAARFKKSKIVYHVHEVNLQPAFLKKILFSIADNYADEVIFVSEYAAACCAFKKAATRVVYNVLPVGFSLQAADIVSPNIKTPFTVSMLCSLKAGKGIYEFVHIAAKMPRIRFILALNASEKAIQQFIKEVKPTINCQVIPAQEDTLSIYRQSHLVVNLSKPKEWVETFGMTILEAMSCGRPVIVPPVGGVCELIDHGVEGFCLDATRENSIITAINRLSSDIRMYSCFAAAAREKSLCFQQQKFTRAINRVFDSANPGLSVKKERVAAFENVS
jgi:L-malate glycosyltransferase